MRRLLIALILALPAIPQCTTPTGTTFTESFGDSKAVCWDGGPSSCTQRWQLGAGTGFYAIAASPGTPDPNTACANSLQMTVTAGASAYLYTSGSFPRIPSGTTADIYLRLYVESQGFAASDYQNVLVVGPDKTGGTYAARLRFKLNVATLQIGAGGSTSSTYVNLSLNAWHTLRLHVDATAASSYFNLDGGANQTFTANAQDITYLVLGSSAGNYKAVTYDVGDLHIDSSVGGGFPYSVISDFESGSNGDAVSAANLGAGTHAGNGTWAITGPAGMTISTSSQMALAAPVSVAGTSYDGSGTRGFYCPANVGNAGVNPIATYTFSTTHPTATVSILYKTSVTNISTGSGYSIGSFGASGVDTVPIHWAPQNATCIGSGNPYACCTGARTGCDNKGYVYLWIGQDPALGTGANTMIGPLDTNTAYKIVAQYVRGDKHTLSVYSTAGTLIGSVQFAAANTAQCTGAGSPFKCCTGPGAGANCASQTARLPNSLAICRVGGEDGYTDPGGGSYDSIVLDTVGYVAPAATGSGIPAPVIW